MGIPNKPIKDFTPEEAKEYARIKSRMRRDRNPEKINEAARKWRSENKERYLDSARRWRAKNPDKVKAATKTAREKNRDLLNEKTRIWRLKNKDRIAKYYSEYRARPEVKKRRSKQSAEWGKKERERNPGFKILCALRIRLHQLIGSSVSMKSKTLGLSSDELRAHLERKFKPGMTWENYGKEWVCDHEIPCANYDFNDPRSIRECFSLFNLQPLWTKENRSKWMKIMKQTELVLDTPLGESMGRA